jgi:putative flippase GtrA
MSLVRKLVRYAAVSAIATALSLTILGALVATGTTTAGWANLIATGVGTVPSFELNRRWVWGKRGSRSIATEIGPFCALSFAGLALSTIAVSGASRWATGDGLGVGARTLVAELANVATFATLWVAQFVILDRVLFRSRSREAPSLMAPSLEDDERVDLLRAA